MKAAPYIAAAVGILTLATAGFKVKDSIVTQAEAGEMIAKESAIRERGDLQNQLDRSRDRLAFLNAKQATTVDDAEEKDFLRAQIRRLQERLEELSK